MKYDSLHALALRAQEQGVSLSQLLLQDEAKELETTTDEVMKRMTKSLRVMEESVAAGLEKDLKSTSGLTGGDAWKMSQRKDNSLVGPTFVGALTKAIAVSETNACMGRIVAAPTAGSCGILPACLLTVMEERSIPEEQVVMALFTASAVGMVAVVVASLCALTAL